MNTKKNVCRYGHQAYREWVSTSGKQKRICYACAKEKSVASRAKQNTKYAPVLVARYETQIAETEAKIIKLQDRINRLTLMKERYLKRVLDK